MKSKEQEALDSSFVRMTTQQEHWIPAYAGMTRHREHWIASFLAGDRNCRNPGFPPPREGQE